MPGPTSKFGNKPGTEIYKCPVKDCKTQPRGDDISKHFKRKADLKALDQAIANQSTLKKTALTVLSGDVVEKSDEYLNSLLLLAKASEAVKEHTKYMFQHGHSSKELPTCDSINFKCQQEIEKAKKRPHSVTFENFFLKKKVKNSEESDAEARLAEATSTSIENVKIN